MRSGRSSPSKAALTERFGEILVKSNKRKNVAFWVIEAILLVATGCYAFAVIGYITFALSLLAIAVLIAMYRVISIYGRRNAKAAKTLRTILTTLVCLGLAFFTVIEVFVISSAHTDKDPEAPYLIVLGAGVNGTEPSLSLLERLKAAKQYLDEYPKTTAIVSGGQGAGEKISEAECMSRWLTDNGISEDRILMETKSTSTYENLKYSLEIIRENGGMTDKVALLSGEYHLYRAKYYAKEFGANVVGIAANTSYPILKTNYFIREAFGVAVMWLI